MNQTDRAQAEAVAHISEALNELDTSSVVTDAGDTVAYVRMSTYHEGAEGVKRDAVRVVRHAQEQGFKLRPDPETGLPVFCDNAISASKYGLRNNWKRRRESYLRMGGLIDREPIVRLLTPHMDRLYRTSGDLDVLCNQVVDVNEQEGRSLEVLTLDTGRYDLLRSDDEIRARLEVTVDAHQSDRTHERIMVRNNEKRAKGAWVGSSGGLGYTRTKEPPHLVLNEWSETIRKGIEDVIRGVTMAEIARAWTAADV